MENPHLKNLNSISDDELDGFSGGYILDWKRTPSMYWGKAYVFNC